MIVSAGAVVGDGVVHRPGWLAIRDGTIDHVGSGAPPSAPDLEFPSGTVVPGFVDQHVHGGGGASYTDGDPDQVRAAAAFHRAHGTTTTVTSTVSASPDELAGIVARLAPLVRDGVSAGIHLEGPWIAHSRCGAHAPDRLRAPDLAEIDRLLEIADGTIVMVTIAPELPGALDAVDRLVAAGVLVAVGHTDATYAQTRAALDRGARVATHLFNAMAPLGHREPGPVLALTEDPRVVVELIGDGVHLHPALVADVQRTVGSARTSLVTDAMVAAGMADGDYVLGSLDVYVADGVARLRSNDAIAGSTATMDALFVRTVAGLVAEPDPMTRDDALLAASAMCSTTPARVLGRSDIGLLTVGRRADLVVLDEELQVQHVTGIDINNASGAATEGSAS
ncbi:N-acetylglucosamine-6-phosphate deacetylase [Gordonia sp. HY002]|uniref:N-acetylglucosamine-6-phosphate deacetylase n=1 Tax=Gordonia zhenghanii TaxID=2911516 RepID=UPI001EF0264D|nr:N-acetylglucosamine-6-phosphate deacetylase [Gordonia zhenghanii]MCF8571607.1 N-acetylglucosamine-6-phosphate deacetylase [Gordonia zhenghanii]MCF8602204.1 N-acetylglucosamine-6-phosphate deacetylase [Gordonia zhenghanii]